MSVSSRRFVRAGVLSQLPTNPAMGLSGIGMAIPGHLLVYQTPEELTADLDHLVELGVSWLRTDIATTFFDNNQSYNWTELDRVISAVDARGIRIVGIIVTLPDHLTGGNWKLGPTTENQRQTFATYAEAVATRYNGIIDAWEVWNEPNLDQFWDPTPSAADYVELLKITYPALKIGAPNTPVLSGGLGGADESSGSADITSSAFVSQMYALGAKNYFDALAVHPYSSPSVVDGGEMYQASLIRTTMDQNGDAAKPIWGTEVGFPTSGNYSATEAEQATFYQDLYSEWKNIHDRGPLFWYTLNDMDIADREGFFGVVRADGSQKPAYTTIQQISALPENQ